MKQWKCLKSEIVYDSRYFKVRKDIVELPNGAQKEWTYWDSSDSAMVIGMTKNKKVVMIRQYRYMTGAEVIEFPSGMISGSESVEECARREFEEESGYTSKSLIKLGSFYETYGQLNRQIHIFYAPDAVQSKEPVPDSEDIPEQTEVVLVDFEKVVNMAMENKIVAMGSALAVLILKTKLDGEQIDGR